MTNLRDSVPTVQLIHEKDIYCEKKVIIIVNLVDKKSLVFLGGKSARDFHENVRFLHKSKKNKPENSHSFSSFTHFLAKPNSIVFTPAIIVTTIGFYYNYYSTTLQDNASLL
jgi:hypothetical protein